MIIVAALLALIQLGSARSGSPSPLTIAATSVAALLEEVTSAIVTGVRTGGTAVVSLPALERDNAQLRSENRRLADDNEHLHELVTAYSQAVAIAPKLETYPNAVQARVIGYPPEGAVQSVTIDRGTHSGIHRDDGVLAANGVVGRVVEAAPFTSKVALITDFTSNVPAIVQRGRYWGIAKGNLGSVRLEYVSQDAPIRVGDTIVTGEGRSFHSGSIIGSIVKIERGDSNLYQTAVLKPAVDLSTLDRVVVVPQ